MSATPLRGGLTQALGCRKAFCNCVARKPDFLASVRAALRSSCRHVASSVKSVWRAHASYASRWSASETVIDAVSVPQLTWSLRLHLAESSRVRVRAFPLRLSASAPRFHSPRLPSRLTIRSSRPHVVASATCYALRLHVSAAPPRGGLTQALGPNQAS